MAKTNEKITIPIEGGKADYQVVDHDRWIAARKKVLAAEKKFTRQRDELNRLRRELPWDGPG